MAYFQTFGYVGNDFEIRAKKNGMFVGMPIVDYCEVFTDEEAEEQKNA